MIAFSLFLTLLTLIPFQNHLMAFANETLFFQHMDKLDPIAAQTNGLEDHDLSTVKRVLEAYKRAVGKHADQKSSLWQAIFNERHTVIHQTFLYGPFEKAAAILRNPDSTDLFWGIDALASSSLSELSNPTVAYRYAAWCLDGLLRFAEAIGAIRLHHPGSPSPSSHAWRAETIIEKIEQTLGQPISFPNPYPNEPGAWTPQGIVSFRAPQALYQAWRIKQLLQGMEHPRVLEIGAGLGRTAYYARQLGIEDYTIVDLPLTAAASGYFLARTLGEDKVQFFEETTKNPEQRVKFLSPAEFLTNTDSYDLIINADSLTEMHPQTAQAYWTRIEKNKRLFLSINHEINAFTVKEIINDSEHVSHVQRTPYWLRHGYVEELVQFKP